MNKCFSVLGMAVALAASVGQASAEDKEPTAIIAIGALVNGACLARPVLGLQPR